MGSCTSSYNYIFVIKEKEMIRYFKHLTKMMTTEQEYEFIGVCIEKAFEILDRNRQGKVDYSKDKTLKQLIFDKAEYFMTHCYTSLGSDVYPTGADIYDELCDTAVKAENKMALETLNEIDRVYFAYKWDKLYHSSKYDFYQIAEEIAKYYQLK